MPTLGQMLLKDKVVTKGQLEEAIQNQVIFGGRLGTNLLELQYVYEDTLAKYLARKHGVPTVDWTMLNRINPKVLKLFTKKLAKNTEGFPIRDSDKEIYVVMADPANLDAIQEIRFATGKEVKPLVLPEVRVFDLLTRFYGIGREMRYIGLASRYTKTPKKDKKVEKKRRPVPPGMTKEQLEERERILKGIDFSASQDLQSEEVFQKLADRQFLAEAGEQDQPIDAGMMQAEEPAAQPEVPREPAPPPPVPSAPAPAEAGPPSKPPPAPRRGPQPFKETAQLLYTALMKNGAEKYIAKEHLQEFIKLFVKNQLKNFVLPTAYLANWMIIEADADVEWLEVVLAKFKREAEKAGVIVVLPGEREPEMPVEAPPPAAAEPEVVEEPAPPPGEWEVREPGRAGPAAGEVLELTADDLVSVEEAETFVPVEEPEEEEEEEYEKLTLDQARQKLLTEVKDRHDISRIVLGFAKGFFKRSLLFTVRRETLYGWDGVGPGISSGLAESIMLGLDEQSVFQLVNTTKSFFLGPVQPAPANERFLKQLGKEKPNNVFIMPVVVNERVVYMFYGDNGGGEFVPVNAPEVQILAYQIPRALDQLIQRKKASKPRE